MKAIITLLDKPASKDLIKEIDYDELREYLSRVIVIGLDLTLKGDFFVTFYGTNLWIEQDETVLLRIPLILVKDFVIKENL